MSEIDVRRQKLDNVVPRRRAKTGTKPTFRTIETDDAKERWK